MRMVQRLSAWAVFAGVALTAAAAPGLKPHKEVPTADPDRVVGVYGRRDSCPVLTVRAETPTGPAYYDYWLVFRRPGQEAEQTKDLVAGQPLAAVGRAGRGGKFLYLVVDDLEGP